MADAPEIGRLALSLFARWTVPCFFVSAATAVGWLEGAHPERVRDPVVMAVALAALLLVLVHVRVGARARRIATMSG
jgi:succinate dehydrogenase hydrophobic anchor subunit